MGKQVAGKIYACQPNYSASRPRAPRYKSVQERLRCETSAGHRVPIVCLCCAKNT